ncbi:MAG: pyridoxal phosphate-dependent aminotransferase [Syntrophomonadaceae bacterium]|jgi:cystathionine beta-lyase|nr:pyridoxal phosphate-dependent aminotransferase [Syntrophomonadaceae bacterium]
MKYDFDSIIDRRNTDSIKFNPADRGRPDDVLPFWVADMDFQSPPCVLDALSERVRHGIFGYSDTDRNYFEVLGNWFASRFGWEIKPEWLVKTPGVVNAIYTAVRSQTLPGESIIINQPVYYPFSAAVKNNQRNLVVSELLYENHRYGIDFEDFEQKILKYNVKMFILCNPHNPVGRVWTREELTRLGEICLRHGVIVAADEIHADFIYPGNEHLVFAALHPSFRDMTITFTSPSKTFNLAGLQLANNFISNAEIRTKFKKEFERSGLSQLSAMGIVAGRAAYAYGADWLEELLLYLNGNLDFTRRFLNDNLPQIELVEPEGTYLAWLDCRSLRLSVKELEDFILHQARLWLDGGTMFGAGGAGFQRINIACPQLFLQKALNNLQEAVNRLARG